MNTTSKLLIGIALFVAVTAFGGGIGLIATNGLGMPLAWLQGSPFSSYIVPGLILLIVVGGTHIVAAISQISKSFFAPFVSAVAGFGLLIWTFTEIYIIQQPHWLQILYFSLAMSALVLAVLQIVQQISYGNTNQKIVSE